MHAEEQADAAELRALREVTRGYLAAAVDHANTDAVLATAAFDRAGWRALAGLGLVGTGIGEDLGGIGLGLPASLLVHEEMGRALYGGPFLGTVGQVVPGLLSLGESAAARRRLELIAAGELTAAAALPLDDRAEEEPVRLTPDGDGWRLDGTLPFVVDAGLADGLLVAATSPAGPGLAWVDTAAPGVNVHPLPTVDLTRHMARVGFDAAPAEPMAGPEQAGQALEAIRRGAVLALAADCIGLAGRALELTVEYVRTRRQFNRPVGSFQAVKHRCAELLVELESARSALVLASTAAGSALEARARLAAASIRAGGAAFVITNEAIHLHGGIGFTWEYPLHLYYRRAKSNQQLLDPAGDQRIRLAATVAALYTEQEDVS